MSGTLKKVGATAASVWAIWELAVGAHNHWDNAQQAQGHRNTVTFGNHFDFGGDFIPDKINDGIYQVKEVGQYAVAAWDTFSAKESLPGEANLNVGLATAEGAIATALGFAAARYIPKIK